LRHADDLEEPLLFDLEGEEELAAAAAASGSTTAAASAAALAETSSVISAVPSSLGHLRAVTKDALGTHVQTEQYTMHIEEVGLNNKSKATASAWHGALACAALRHHVCSLRMSAAQHAVHAQQV
jgi:hypothetical protein